METTITGTNALTYPHLHVWGWEVVIYLFLGGLAAGLLVMSAIANFSMRKPEEKDQAFCFKGPFFACLILVIGVFFIWLDLGRKFNFFWLYLSFEPLSPMSWGSWALAITIPISGLYGLSAVPDTYKGWLKFDILKKVSAKLNPFVRKLAVMNFGLGIFIGIYTGVLLSAFVARPLWNSSILPVLFLNSALSTGAALAIIMAKRTSVKLYFTKIDIWLIFSEIVIILLFFYGHYASAAAQRKSIIPFFSFNGDHILYGTAILMVAILLPLALVIEMFDVKDDIVHDLTKKQISRMKVSAAMVLAGGFIIRLAIVYAGQLSGLS